MNFLWLLAGPRITLVDRTSWFMRALQIWTVIYIVSQCFHSLWTHPEIFCPVVMGQEQVHTLKRVTSMKEVRQFIDSLWSKFQIKFELLWYFKLISPDCIFSGVFGFSFQQDLWTSSLVQKFKYMWKLSLEIKAMINHIWSQIDDIRDQESIICQKFTPQWPECQTCYCAVSCAHYLKYISSIFHLSAFCLEPYNYIWSCSSIRQAHLFIAFASVLWWMCHRCWSYISTAQYVPFYSL